MNHSILPGVDRQMTLPWTAKNRFRIAYLAFVTSGLWGWTDTALALPSYAIQTNQPCAACHVGAFGPQLTQFGRDFKLFGYIASDGKPHFPPLAVTTITSFNHTAADEPGNVPHFAANDNFAADQISLYYTGRITPEIGAFAQVTYDGVQRQFHIDNTDIRSSRDTEVLGTDLVYGVTLNNSPTVSDLWNSTPVWGFPYNASPIAATPAASTALDGELAQNVIGLGAYAEIGEWVFVELDGYEGLNAGFRNALGVVPVTAADTFDGISPYWKVAITHEFDGGHENFEFGTYGLQTSVFPGGNTTVGSDQLEDTALDANFQWVANTKDVTSSIVSFHGTFIHENQNLQASHVLFGTNAHDELNELRGDVSYSYGAMLTPTIQYFNVQGTTDPNRFPTPSGSPNSSGVIMELAYVPFGKPDSIISYGNARLALQYVAYDKFNGTTTHAGDNNTLYLSLWLALGLNP